MAPPCIASTNSRGCGLKVSAKMRSSREIHNAGQDYSRLKVSTPVVRIFPGVLNKPLRHEGCIYTRRGVNGRWNCDRNTARTSSLHGLCSPTPSTIKRKSWRGPNSYAALSPLFRKKKQMDAWLGKFRRIFVIFRIRRRQVLIFAVRVSEAKDGNSTSHRECCGSQ